MQKIVGRNKFHQPWRSTAWEIHPVMKLELAEGAALSSSPQGALAPAGRCHAASVAATPSAPSPEVTLVKPVKVKIRYGETMLPAGIRLPMVGRSAYTVTARYMGEEVYLPLHSTDQPAAESSPNDPLRP